MEITQTLEENIEKINDIINELNNLKIEIEGEGIEKQDWIDYERLKGEIENTIGI